MVVTSPRHIGALIRDQRKRLALDQQTVAIRAGVSRKWLVGVEQGKPGAELGLVLRTLDVLGLELTIEPSVRSTSQPSVATDIDAIVSRARKKAQ